MSGDLSRSESQYCDRMNSNINSSADPFRDIAYACKVEEETVFVCPNSTARN